MGPEVKKSYKLPVAIIGATTRFEPETKEGANSLVSSSYYWVTT
jgi:hypothetical protein